jgi:hypothetical protein
MAIINKCVDCVQTFKHSNRLASWDVCPNCYQQLGGYEFEHWTEKAWYDALFVELVLPYNKAETP